MMIPFRRPSLLLSSTVSSYALVSSEFCLDSGYMFLILFHSSRLSLSLSGSLSLSTHAPTFFLGL